MNSTLGEPKIFIKCVNCSCMSMAFKQLTNDQLIKVDRHRSEVKFKKGEILCKQGAFMSYMMFVREGLIKIYLESDEHPTIVAVETNGHFIGLPSIFSSNEPVYPYTIEALTDTEVCQVSIDLFKEFCAENHQFSTEIIKMLSKEVMKGYDNMFNLTQRQIRGRFAELILHLKRNIYHATDIDLTINRKDMADLISTSPESISRLIKEFNSEGILHFHGNHLRILDQEKLNYITQVG